MRVFLYGDLRIGLAISSLGCGPRPGTGPG